MMDDILNLGDDISGIFDMPNSVCAEDILRDLDSIDFDDVFNDGSAYDDGDDDGDENQMLNTDTYYPMENINVQHINGHVNKYESVKREALDAGNQGSKQILVNKNAEQKLMIIRELLDSNICDTPSEVLSTLSSCNSRSSYTKPCGNQTPLPPEQIKSNHLKTTSKHPAILPATNMTSANLLKSPTLAATLIGMQPSKLNGINTGTSNHFNGSDSQHTVTTGTGRVVRRNSHNAIEKRYRLSINDKIDELRRMLFLGDESKMNKSNVLKKAIERIKNLEDENNALKCELFNIRAPRNPTTNNSRHSYESLNQTGSSPSSSNSECGHSIENSPSSSSMYSSSITSGSLFAKSNEGNKTKIPNSTRGLKRPLIYNSNVPHNENPNVSKNEKLARLLLDSKDNYIQPESYSGNNQGSHNKIHSSNVPGFLLCTLALFVVSFHPFDFVFKNHQFKSTFTTTGRRLLLQNISSSEDINDNGYLFSMLLTLAHWCVAFVLVWGSNYNRFLLKKSFSELLYNLKSYFFSLFCKRTSHSFTTLFDLKNSLDSVTQDQALFKLKLDCLLEEYGCSYNINPIQKFIQFSLCLINIFFSTFPFVLKNGKTMDETRKIRIYLLTLYLNRNAMDQSYSQLELLWYQCLLYSLSWKAKVSGDILFSRLVLGLSMTPDLLRKYFLNQIFRLAASQRDTESDKLKLILVNSQAQKFFIKIKPEQLMDKLSVSYYLKKRITVDRPTLVNGYFMFYAQETFETSSQILLNGRTDPIIMDNLKDIVTCCQGLLDKDESHYFSAWGCLLIALSKNLDYPQSDKSAAKLIAQYAYVLTKFIKSDDELMNSSLVVLNLLMSAIRLSGDGKQDKLCHDVNLQCLQRLSNSFSLNITFQMLLKLSLDWIVEALGNSSSLKCVSSTIYYANAYSSRIKQTSSIELEAKSRFNALLQRLCHINPLKLISLPMEEKDNSRPISSNDLKKIDDLSFRITDFLSSERDSKLRSH